MKILFIEPKGITSAVNLGYAYLCTSVVNHGHTAYYLDLNRFEDEQYEKMISESIEKNAPEMVGMSVYDVNYDSALKYCAYLKSKYPELPIVIGGPHAKALKEKVLDCPHIDYAFHGECENTFVEFLHKWERHENFSSTDGLIHRTLTGAVVANPARLYDDVNLLPTPNYDYWGVNEIPGWMLLTSRGCPYQCSFCSRNLGQKWRRRDPKQCVDELVEAKRRWNIQGFRIIDASFNLLEEHVIDFCAELKKSGLNLPWMASGIRVDLLTDDSVKAMKEAGCVALMVGIESVAPKVIELMKKSLTYEEVERGFSYCKKHNLRMAGYMIVGLPGDTYKDAIYYGKKIIDLGIDPLSFNNAVPLHGTPLYDWVQDQNNAQLAQHTSWKQAYSDTEVSYETSDFTSEERLRARRELMQYNLDWRRDHTEMHLRILYRIEKFIFELDDKFFGLRKRFKLIKPVANYLLSRSYPYNYSEICTYSSEPHGLTPIRCSEMKTDHAVLSSAQIPVAKTLVENAFSL